MKRAISILTGFMILFLLYHGAEYMIVYKNNAGGFLLFHAAFFVAAYLVAKWQFGNGLATWGLRFTRKTIIQIVCGFAFGIMLYSATFCISLMAGAEKIDLIPPLSKISGTLALFVFGNLFASFSEDVLTRAYVYKHLHGKVHIVVLSIISGIIYVLNHIYRLTEGFETIFYLFCLGIFLIIPLIKSRQLWLTGSIHWGSNCAFFMTHEIWKTSTLPHTISPNYIFAAVLILFGIVMLAIPNRYYHPSGNSPA